MYGELQGIRAQDGNEYPAFPVVIHNPLKTAALRLPTSEEISTYTGSIRQLIRRLGRRQSEDQDVPNEAAERRFFDAIRLDKSGEEFDAAEIKKAIDQILLHQITDCQRDGDRYAVTIRTLWGSTVHTVRTPLTREIQVYREGVIRSRELPHNVEERRFPPEVPAALYDAIVLRVEGYTPQFNVIAGGNGQPHVYEGGELKSFLPTIPPHHKRSVAGEISSQLYELDPSLDPNG